MILHSMGCCVLLLLGEVCGDWRVKKTWQVEKCMVPRCKAARKPRGEKDTGNRKPDK